MSNFYLDVETSSLHPEDGELVTIQYQKLDFDTKKAIGPLVILKAWESSEKEILEKFHKVFGPAEEKWSFVSHTYNGFFERKWLLERSKFHGLPPLDLFSKPCVDLHPIGIMMVGGFKGSGLDKISGKEGDGSLVIEAIEEKDYPAIEAYIKQETEAYIELLVYLTANMHKVLEEFRVYVENKSG